MERVECAVIGAGVVGLAIARALAESGREVLILEEAAAIGSATSSRNSEVIHAGIYYPDGSLKAAACVRGKHLLYDYLRERGIAHDRCGKLIVATQEAQIEQLDAIQAKAKRAGVNDLRWLSAADVTALEPEVRCARALFSPSTGVFDSHHFMLSLLGDAEEAGASLALNAPLTQAEVDEAGTVLRVGGAAPLDIKAKLVVNASGLFAPALATRFAGLPQHGVPRAYFAKGNYYRLQGAGRPFSRLVYPVPEAAGLGIHVTVDLEGQARFGPDVEWLDAPDYRVNSARAEAFYRAIRRYYPNLPEESLVPDYAGVRPKIVPQGQGPADFILYGPHEHGVSGNLHLFGIESPGLTASMAIAEQVVARLNI